MKITVTCGTGEGPTSLAAFDAALRDAGVCNFNLIPLSSVIPPGAEIVRAKFKSPDEEYGYKLYVVISKQEANEPGNEAWAGLGWVQEAGNGRGLFVEIHDVDRDAVEKSIHETLVAMQSYRSIFYGDVQSEHVGIRFIDKPVCAVAIAVYQSEDWT